MKSIYRQIVILIFLPIVLAAACSEKAAALPIPLTTNVEQFSSNSLPIIQSPTTAAPTIEVTSTIVDQENVNVMEANSMIITIGNHVLTATLAENSSADALKEALLQSPITVDMRDYVSMEKVGSLGMELPRNDQQITTEAGDIILYQGNALVIYYAPNTWNFTRLGKINDASAEELKEILGDGDVTVTLSLPQE